VHRGNIQSGQSPVPLRSATASRDRVTERQAPAKSRSRLIVCSLQSRRDGIGVAQGGSPGNACPYRRAPEGRHRPHIVNPELAYYLKSASYVPKRRTRAAQLLYFHSRVAHFCTSAPQSPLCFQLLARSISCKPLPCTRLRKYRGWGTLPANSNRMNAGLGRLVPGSGQPCVPNRVHTGSAYGGAST